MEDALGLGLSGETRESSTLSSDTNIIHHPTSNKIKNVEIKFLQILRFLRILTILIKPIS
jgi:hypothetical protein